MALNIQPFQFNYGQLPANRIQPQAPVWGPPDVSKQLQEGIGGLMKNLEQGYKFGSQVASRNAMEQVGTGPTGQAGQAAGLAQPGGPYAQPQQQGPQAMAKLPTFAQIEGKAPSAQIGGLIQSTTDKYALNPSYLQKLVQIETGGTYDPNSFNKGSKASGLGQFIPSTWRQYGQGGNPFDPALNLDATARLTVDNANFLRKNLGREPTQGELYLAHQQGAQGAVNLLRDPNALASSVVPLRNIMSNGGKPNMTAGQFANLWTSRFGEPQPAFAPRGAAAATQPAAAATNAAVGAPVASVPGDDPVKLRADAAAYQQNNPEAARQLLARAEAAENKARGLPAPNQVASLGPQPGQPSAAQPLFPAQPQPAQPAPAAPVSPQLPTMAGGGAGMQMPALPPQQPQQPAAAPQVAAQPQPAPAAPPQPAPVQPAPAASPAPAAATPAAAGATPLRPVDLARTAATIDPNYRKALAAAIGTGDASMVQAVVNAGEKLLGGTDFHYFQGADGGQYRVNKRGGPAEMILPGAGVKPEAKEVGGVLYERSPQTGQWNKVAGDQEQWRDLSQEEIKQRGYPGTTGAQINTKTGEIKFPGKPGVDLKIDQTVEKTEEVELAKERAKQQTVTATAARSAAQRLNQIARMREVMQGLRTGAGATADLTVGKLGQMIGMSDETLKSLGFGDRNQVAKAELLQALSSKMLSETIGSGEFPANNFSNADRDFLMSQYPSLQNTPVGNAIALRALELDAKRSIEKQRAWREFKQKAGGKANYDDFEDQWSRKIEANPQRLVERPATIEERDKLPKGTLYIDPNGVVRERQ